MNPLEAGGAPIDYDGEPDEGSRWFMAKFKRHERGACYPGECKWCEVERLARQISEVK